MPAAPRSPGTPHRRGAAGPFPSPGADDEHVSPTPSVARWVFAAGAGAFARPAAADDDPWLRIATPSGSARHRFKAAVARHDHCLLVPGFLLRGEPELVPHLAIGAHRPVFRQVEDIRDED